MKNKFTVDATGATFDSEILPLSHDRPVMVDFWAPWCGPCRTLLPIVTKLAEEFGGLFLLAKVNIDEEQELAARFGVRSVPTVKLIRRGEVVDEFVGAQPESAVRAFIERHVERASDKAVAQALRLRAEGDLNGARHILETVLATDPQHPPTMIALAELDSDSGDFASAAEWLSRLTPSQREEKAATNVATRLELAALATSDISTEELDARISAQPNDSEARIQRAARHALAKEYEPAMALLMEVLQRDRRFRDDIARKTLLRIFDLLGSGELVNSYRSQLARALY